MATSPDNELWIDFDKSDETPSHHNITRDTITYFSNLKEQSSSENSSSSDSFFEDVKEPPKNDPTRIVEAPDGLKFDFMSIEQAMTLCNNLQNFFQDLSEADYKKLQKVSSFYQNPEKMCEQIKILFTGGVKAKEEIARIYAARAIGSYKVIRTMLNTPELYYELSNEVAQETKQDLKRNAEEILKRVANIIPRSAFKSLPQDQNPLSSIKQVLAQKEPLFHKGHPYATITKRFRELILWVKANPSLLTYLDWKQKYLKYWIYTELHFLDEQNLESKQHKRPEYSLIKSQNYRKLEELFSELDAHEQSHYQLFELRKHHHDCLASPVAFSSQASSKSEVKKARKAERELLNSLSLNQLCTFAAAVHADIVAAIRENKLPGILPSGVNNRSLDWDSEEKADKKYMNDTVNAQVEIAQEEETTTGRLKNALGTFSKKMQILPKKKDEIDQRK